ncbi:MAG: peptidoglycan DD-metalloendopeptidase family protein [Limnobacter sp.]|nr:peptidoglycan DD-metalloendopeptidase family protein [Limnobacter sp.]
MLQKLLEILSGLVSSGAKFSHRAFAVGLSAAAQILPQNPRQRKWVILGCFSLPVLGAVVAVAGSMKSLPQQAYPGVETLVVEALDLEMDDQGIYNAEPLVAYEEIRRGDNVLTVLKRIGVDTTGLYPFLVSDPLGQRLFENLVAGRTLEVQQGLDGNLKWMRYLLEDAENHREALLVNRSPNGDYTAQLEQQKFERQVEFRAGRIDSSLFSAADKAELPEAVAIQMTEIFSSQIDFHRELRAGDTFRVVYESMLLEGQLVGTGKVLAVEFVNGGKPYKAYWFTGRNSSSEYYDENGMSMRKTFLRAPLKVSRVSSGFTMRRFHPIQKRWKAHTGVDYAAPTGTPIYATAKGVVSYSGVMRGYGNIVEIAHSNGYKTRYAHMSRINSGVRKGTRVDQGELVGYVGSTGWATGPHLHYEVRVNDIPHDPLSLKFAMAEPLDRSSLGEFKRVQAALDRRLDLASTMRLAYAE